MMRKCTGGPPPLSRRSFLASTVAGLGAAVDIAGANGQPAADVSPRSEEGMAWRDVRQWGVEGRGWTETENYFDRLPAQARELVRDPVWELAHHSAGMCVRFATDATTISARYELVSPRLELPHMPATGVSGLDLYAQSDQGRWRWLGAARPAAQHVTTRLAAGITPGLRSYLLYLPLYNGISSLQIGVPAAATFHPQPPRTRPLVFYGTSITQGGCASRPGMAYPAILGRRLDRPIINLGFSGNGKMDEEMGDLLAELDAGVYVIDCSANLFAPAIEKRTPPLVRKIRDRRPRTPIVLLEDRTFANGWLVPGKRDDNLARRKALRAAYERLTSAGMTALYYVEGQGLLGDDDEATVDASHPTDLGMLRIADLLEPVLRPLAAALP